MILLGFFLSLVFMCLIWCSNQIKVIDAELLFDPRSPPNMKTKKNAASLLCSVAITSPLSFVFIMQCTRYEMYIV